MVIRKAIGVMFCLSVLTAACDNPIDFRSGNGVIDNGAPPQPGVDGDDAIPTDISKSCLKDPVGCSSDPDGPDGDGGSDSVDPNSTSTTIADNGLVTTTTQPDGGTGTTSPGDGVTTTTVPGGSGPGNGSSGPVTTPDGELKAIKVNPAQAEVALGTTIKLSVEATFTKDGKDTTKDVTADSQFTLENSNLANVLNKPGEFEAKARANDGKVGVEAIYKNKTARSQIVVTPAKVKSIEIRPAQLSLTLGGEGEVKAIALMTDGSSENVSAAADWGVVDSTVATMNGAGPTGTQKFKGLKLGESNFSATYLTVKGTAKLIVSNNPAAARTLKSIRLVEVLGDKVLDAPATDLFVGQKRKLRVIATYYKDASMTATEDATVPDAEVEWSTSNDKIVEISSQGEVSGVAVGSATASAKFGAKMASVSYSVKLGVAKESFKLSFAKGVLDLMYVIDNSASMTEEIAQVVKNFSSFANQLTEKSDVHLTLVSADKSKSPLYGVEFPADFVTKCNARPECKGRFRHVNSLVHSRMHAAASALAFCPGDDSSNAFIDRGGYGFLFRVCGEEGLAMWGINSKADFDSFSGQMHLRTVTLPDNRVVNSKRAIIWVTDDDIKRSSEPDTLGSTQIDEDLFLRLIRGKNGFVTPKVYAFANLSQCKESPRSAEAIKAIVQESGGLAFDICPTSGENQQAVDNEWKAQFDKLIDDLLILANGSFALQNGKGVTIVKVSQGDRVVDPKYYRVVNGVLGVDEAGIAGSGDTTLHVEYNYQY